MKVRVERDQLAHAVASAARTLPTRPSMPVLAGLVLTADSGHGTLTVSGFDYEVSSLVTIPADDITAGKVIVPGRLLADIARALPAAPVVLTVDGSRLIVSAGKSNFTLPLMPLEDYPALPAMPDATGVVDPEEFVTAVASVALAATRDDTLPALTGVRVELTSEAITFAATDRYRLAIHTIPWKPTNPTINGEALVPAKTLLDTAKALAAADSVTLAFDDGVGMLGLEGTAAGIDRRTTTRLLDGQFPPYRTLLPNPADTAVTAVVETAVLQDALKRVALVTERNIPVRLIFTDGSLELRAGTGNAAHAQDQVDITLTKGEEIEVAFNPTYLADGLTAVNAPYTRFSFTAPAKPAILTGLAEANADPTSDYIYLLMPVRIPQ